MSFLGELGGYDAWKLATPDYYEITDEEEKALECGADGHPLASVYLRSREVHCDCGAWWRASEDELDAERARRYFDERATDLRYRDGYEAEIEF